MTAACTNERVADLRPREFKLEVVRLVKDRGAPFVQAARG